MKYIILNSFLTAIEAVGYIIQAIGIFVEGTAQFIRDLTDTPAQRKAVKQPSIESSVNKANDITFTLRGHPRVDFHTTQLKTKLDHKLHASLCLDLGMKIIESCETKDDIWDIYEEYCLKAEPILSLPKPPAVQQ